MSAAADLEVAVREIVKDINNAAKARADRGLNIMRNAALEVLSHETHGRRYGKHIASTPGATPNPDAGNLRKNWRRWKEAAGGTGNLRIILKMKSRMHYADYLEFGTKKMSARPFREPIRKEAIPKIQALFSSL